jgi:OmpA-OmpF porin, OOP family
MKSYFSTLIFSLIVLNGIAQVRTDETNKAAFKTYSKFDFVPGEKVTAIEDFMQDAIGDFPARWNTNGSGEIVTIEGESGHWLQMNGNTTIFPEFVNGLPENCTLEFKVAVNPELNYAARWFSLFFTPSTEPKKLFTANFPSRVEVAISPLKNVLGVSSVNVYGSDSKQLLTNRISTTKFSTPQKPMVKVSIWRQKERLRVYLDEEKVWDIPRAFDAAATYQKLVFRTNNLITGQYFYFSGFRFAIGAPDTRNKLITEGKFITTGILFDSNSDKIKPESYGTLKQIAQVLQENTDVNVRIVGHTDADGDDAKNLELSKRRAAAVKANLSTEFGIDAARLQTDGKGETQPTTPNTTTEGKANNRRVEFVKI